LVSSRELALAALEKAALDLIDEIVAGAETDDFGAVQKEVSLLHG
jgi:hypothetical protein